MVEMTSIDQSIDLKFDTIARLGNESVPAVLMFVKFKRFDLTVA